MGWETMVMGAFRASKYLGSGAAECSVFMLWSISAVMAVKFNLFCMRLSLPVMLHAFQLRMLEFPNFYRKRWKRMSLEAGLPWSLQTCSEILNHSWCHALREITVNNEDKVYHWVKVLTFSSNNIFVYSKNVKILNISWI